MGTTPRGIVYPESSDHTRLWEHFETLADSVDAALSDAPTWTTLTGLSMGSGYTLTSARYLTVGDNPPAAGQSAQVVLDLVVVRGASFTFGSDGNIGDSPVATGLPANLCPAANIYLPMHVSGTLTAWLRITSGGALTITHGSPNATVAAGNSLICHGSYWRG